MKPSFKSTFALAALLGASWFTMPAQAGIFDDDEARKAILKLREQVDALKKQADMMEARVDTKSDKSVTLDLLSANDALRADVARLRGQVEVLTNELSNAQQRQKDFYVDLDNRLRKLEPKQVNVDGKDASVAPDEQRSYDAALAVFQGGDYKNAAIAFSDFVRRYPGSAFAPAAQYWIGNSLYAQRDYKNAIEAQQAVVKNFPDSAKAPDALLNVASCYSELKQVPQAKKTLQLVISNYPGTPAAQTAKERLAALK